MPSRLSDYYNSYYGDVIENVKDLDYGENFYKAIEGSHYGKCVELLEGILRDAPDASALRALDIGVGTGAMLHWLRHKGLDPEGVDISERLVNLMKEKGFKALLHDMNEDPLPRPAESYDIVISMDVLEHVICPIYFMEQVERVCAPGGHVIISTANSRTLKALYTLMVKGRFPWTCPERHGWDCGHLHYFTSKDVVELGERAGFETLRVEGISPVTPGLKGMLKKLLLATMPKSLTREFIAGTFMILFRKNPEASPGRNK